MIRPQKRADEQHRGASCTNKIRQKRTEGKKDRVYERSTGEFAFHIYSAGNNKQRTEQNQKRNVIEKRVPQQGRLTRQYNGEKRYRHRDTENGFVSIAVPPVRDRHRKYSNGLQHHYEWGQTPQRETQRHKRAEHLKMELARHFSSAGQHVVAGFSPRSHSMKKHSVRHANSG